LQQKEQIRKEKEENTNQVECDRSTYIRGGIQIREEQLCIQNTNYVCLFSAPTRNPLFSLHQIMSHWRDNGHKHTP